MRSTACVASAVPGKKRGDRRRRSRCDAKLRSGTAFAVCGLALNDTEGTPEEERPRRMVLQMPARPKDLVVVVDEDGGDLRRSFSVVSECELKHWRYHEPPYSEKLGVGFAMLAGEPVQL
jgi:hypothetical protein